MTKHISVFKNQAIEALHIKPEGIYVDATLGRGGHSLEIAKQLTTGQLHVFDLDTQAIFESKTTLNEVLDKIVFHHHNYANIQATLNEHNINEVDGILFDLGVSSPQLDNPERGFSYRYDALLDMRMNQQQEFSAYDVVNNYDLKELTRIFKEYGEESFSYKIAQKIVNARPIETTFQLVDVIKSALPAKVLSSKGHPAKRVFQAIRIEVNQELESLKKAIKQSIELLKPGGYCVVITFHSLEDRIVKKAFNEVSKPKKVDKRVPQLEVEIISYEHLTTQVILPTQKELEENPRSQSAKLRILRRKQEI